MTADAASPDTPTDPDVRLAKAQELAPLLLPPVVAVIALSEMDTYGVDAFWDETYWRCRRCDLPSDENEWSDACVCAGWRWVIALLSLSGDSTQTTDGADPDVLAVLEYVSRGRRYVGVERYPDVAARRALGRLHDEGALRSEASGTPTQTGEKT